jgi:mRNA-degrading endonuclease YafQ of YafQ-DinJ toxin-antitoxin module
LIFSKQELDKDNQEHVVNELSQPGPECHVHVDQILVSSEFDNLCEKKILAIQELNK